MSKKSKPSEVKWSDIYKQLQEDKIEFFLNTHLESLQLKLGRRVRHQRPDADWIGTVISRIGKAAKIVVDEADAKTGRPEKYASAHDLRRSCGEQLREAGVPPLVISRVMRHSSWETTQRHYAPGNVQSDAEVLRAILKAKPNDSSAAPDRTAENDPE